MYLPEEEGFPTIYIPYKVMPVVNGHVLHAVSLLFEITNDGLSVTSRHLMPDLKSLKTLLSIETMHGKGGRGSSRNPGRGSLARVMARQQS